MSDWGWHKFENTDGLRPDESWMTIDLGHGHQEVYAVEYKRADEERQKAATEYFRANPHRLNLGVIGLEMSTADGQHVKLHELTDVHQVLQLYDGVIESHFSTDGTAVDVTTAALPDECAVVYRVSTPLLREGRARISIRFPYPTGKHADDASDWSKPQRHVSRVVDDGADFVVVEHSIDSTRYFLTLQWDGNAVFTELDRHYFTLTSADGVLTLKASYAEQRGDGPSHPRVEGPFVYDEHLRKIMKWWNGWWQRGGIVDFSRCTDPRAWELERRVVLSQYLTQVNCANRQPPQETGLTYNSWFGRPHLEMTWWHMMDFALWNRPEVMAQVLGWYDDAAAEARRIAERQGFDGIRWMKMTDPWAGEAPSNTGSFLIWQQPHYIYMAEQMYRVSPTESTLEKYGRLVDETAQFMSDFMSYDQQGGCYYLRGATAMQESMSKDFSYNHPFELAYWQYGLAIAQQWRKRRGMAPSEEWARQCRLAASLPMSGGIYTAGLPLGDVGKGLTAFNAFDTVGGDGKDGMTTETFAEKCRSDHPAPLAAFGLLPEGSFRGDSAVAKATLRWVMDNWNWHTTWGWDYGMVAMAAARLGEPETALKALLLDTQKNTYLVNGHNFQTADRLRVYLPGNGALLTAVAMMCAGWDGCRVVNNPGFPADGTWNVRWENLRRMQ